MREDFLLTEEEEGLLLPEQLSEYRYAKACLNDGWANGPYGGWVRGYRALRKLGWLTCEIKEKHSTCTHYTKPAKFTLNKEVRDAV